MNFFHNDLQKKFKKLFKRNLFNLYININFNYIKSLNKKNYEHIIIKINYDEHIGIVAYEIIPYATILNVNSDNEFFIKTINENNHEDIIYLLKNEFIYYPVKTYLRKYIIKKIIETDEDDYGL